MSNEKRVYVDVHVIQTVPPSCVNRDDTGSPKTAVYGGVTRARVSSQCWKNAVRGMFREEFPSEKLGVRTKHIVSMVAAEISKLDPGLPIAKAEKSAQDVLSAAGLKIKSVEKGTDAMFFMSNRQAEELARVAVENADVPAKELKEKARAVLMAYPGIDVALFGRMVADDPSLNNDACAQVAHTISTHKTVNEYDYFTAVDQLKPEESAGAGHIGTVKFNSSTLYRYATVAVHELEKQLNEDTVEAVRGFVKAFIYSMPTGKLNTFANNTLPDAVYVAVRRDQPVNLVGAFECPVPASDKGYAQASISRLIKHAQNTYAAFVDAPELALAAGVGLNEIAETMPAEKLLDALADWLAKNLAGKEE